MAEPSLSAPEFLNASHNVSKFPCGKPSLDHRLKARAQANQQKGFMAVHVAGRVVGDYGLAPTAIVPGTLPRSIRTGQPPNPVPCILLGQLATERAWAGQGIGIGLFNHALAGSVSGAELIGGRALIVNAVDDEVASFWHRRGFLPSKDDAMVLFRSIPNIAASLKAVVTAAEGARLCSRPVPYRAQCFSNKACVCPDADDEVGWIFWVITGVLFKHAGVGALAVLGGYVLHAAIGVVDQPAGLRACGVCSRASRINPACAMRLPRQPTIHWPNLPRPLTKRLFVISGVCRGKGVFRLA